MIPRNEEEERLVGPPWGLADFVLVVLAGFAGAFAVALVILMTEMDVAATVAVSAFGMATGHAVGIYAVLKRRRGSLDDLGFEVLGSDGGFVVLGAALQILIAVVFYPLAREVGADGTTQVIADQIASAQGLGIRIVIVVLVGLVAPVMEEIAFRGILLRVCLRRMGPWTAVAVTAAVFSLFHWLGVDQSNVGAGLLTLGQLLIIGIVLGALTIRRGRLGPAIFTHAGFNLVTLLFLFAPGSLPS